MESFLARPRQVEALARLAAEYPWPPQRPPAPQRKDHGWLKPSTREFLKAAITSETQLAVELGSWLGLSTRFIADCAPQATVIAIDHWRGSPEHQDNQQWAAMLGGLFETFLANCWEYRQRLIPLRVTTLDGLCIVARRGLKPDLIYLDADHGFEAVTADFEYVLDAFPRAAIVGDDWQWQSVREAVLAVAKRRGLLIEACDNAWRLAGQSRKK